MTIAKKTTIQAYHIKAGGVHARMAILRMVAADSVNNRNPSTRMQVGDWKAARNYTFSSYEAAYCAGLNAGFDSTGPRKTAVWYTHTGEYFRDETEGNTGYYTDIFQDEKARGIIGRLPHGRYIAGYTWTANDERVYFDEVFTDEKEAARMAAEHARVFAENAFEDSQACEEARTIETEIETITARLNECYALRNIKRMKYTRTEVSIACAAIREKRETLKTKYANYI